MTSSDYPNSIQGPISIVELIKIEGILYGNGTDRNPLRRITQYWTKDGEFVIEVDPWLESQKMVIS